MYFTKFPINLTRRATAGMLANPYRIHAAIAGSFSEIDRSSGRVLWRIDDADGEKPCLYIVSPDKPSLVGLDEQIGWPDIEPQWRTLPYDSVLDGIRNGYHYAFRLAANPVYRTSRVVDSEGRRKRVAHVTTLQQAAWLIGARAYEGTGLAIPSAFAGDARPRDAAHGFEVISDEATGVPLVCVTRSDVKTVTRAGKSFPLLTVQYDGVLEVRDEKEFRRALVEGIGKAKGFGCGLLTLAPVEA